MNKSVDEWKSERNIENKKIALELLKLEKSNADWGENTVKQTFESYYRFVKSL